MLLATIVYAISRMLMLANNILAFPAKCRTLGAIMEETAMQPKYREKLSDEETRSSRIEARITEKQKQLFREAAKLSGLSLSEFITSSLLQMANQVLREQHILMLAKQDSEKFVEAILNPSEPNVKLVEAFAKYREDFGDTAEE